MADPFDIAVDHYRRTLGLTPEQARGAALWMKNVESGLNPSSFNPAGGGQGALGIAQWRGPRQRSLLSQYGSNPTFEQQLAFSTSELQGPESKALAALRGAKTEQDAFNVWGRDYERLGKPVAFPGGKGFREGYYPEPGEAAPSFHANLAPTPEMPFPAEAVLDQLLGPRALPGEEASATSPAMMLDQLLTAAPEGQAKTEQPAAPASEFIEPGAGVTPAPNLIATSEIPTQPSPAALAQMPHPTPPPETPIQPAQMLDQLLGGGDFSARPSSYVEPPGMGQAAPAAPAARAPKTGPSLLDELLRYAGTSLAAMKAAAEQLPQAAADIGTGVAGLAERARLGGLATMPGQPMRPAQVPVAQAIPPAVGAMEFATGGLMNPLAAPARQIPQVAGNVSRETAGAVPQVMRDTRGGADIVPLGVRREAKQAAEEEAKRNATRAGLEEMRARLEGPETFAVPRAVKDALRSHGLLGFDTIGEALRAIRSHPDWRVRWDMSDETPARIGMDDLARQRFLRDRATIEKYVSRPPGTLTDRDFPARRPSIWEDEGGALRIPPGPRERVSKAARSFRETVAAAKRDAQIKIAPMPAGTDAGMAVAKDEANAERVARYWRTHQDASLRKLPVADQERMWDAMDQASVAAQQYGYDAGLRYIHTLPKRQQEMVAQFETYGIRLWEEGKDAGIVNLSAERLPFYVPRSIVEITEGGAKAPGGEGMSALNQFGSNLTRRGPRSREYMTAEETERAAKERFGEGAEIVRNIRSLPIAYEKFARAIAGRRLINDLKSIGEAAGKPSVLENPAAGYFTIPGHPMFAINRGPNMPGGQLYISKEFEGPLRAIARTPTGSLYNAAMAVKGGAMSLIMNSPLIHNQVEWGRALGAMPGKVATFKIYGIGKKVIDDPQMMEKAIQDGLVPIGQRGYMQDIEGLAMADDLKPGRGMFAKGGGALLDIASPKAGDTFRRGVDKAGDFWHQKLLWDQVAKLQAGLWKEFTEHLVKKGFARDDASKVAAHLANRYAGALPHEAMSENARKGLNILLFSRSFTMGNLGVIKDMFTGLPKDVQAQLGRDLTALEKKALTGIARKKAIATFIADIGIMYTANALLQDGIEALHNDPEGALGKMSLGAAGGMVAGRLAGGIGGALMGGLAGGVGGAIASDWHRVADDYVDRLNHLAHKAEEDIGSLWNPLEDLVELSPVSRNEPGKQERVKVGRRKDETAVYGRVPVGKIGEEFTGWIFRANEMIHNKMGTIARPLVNIFNNDRGFGRKVYNKSAHSVGDYAKNVGSIAWEFIRSQTPDQQLDALMNIVGAPTWMGGQEAPVDWVDWAQAVGPVAGMTFSKGSPGGEVVGELGAARGEHGDKVKAALPRVRDLVKAGKDEAAAKILDDLGVNPKLRNYYLRTYADPSRRASPRQLREFERYGTPEQKRRMQMQQERRDLRHSIGGE